MNIGSKKFDARERKRESNKPFLLSRSDCDSRVAARVATKLQTSFTAYRSVVDKYDPYSRFKHQFHTSHFYY